MTLTAAEGPAYYKTMVFQAQILGVGDYFTRIHNHSSFVINADGRFTLVDCPDGLQKILKEANQVADIGVRLEKINHVIVTHLHCDIQRTTPHRGIHTDYNELLRLPESIKQRVFLIHYPDTANQQDSDLKLLQQGHVYDIK